MNTTDIVGFIIDVIETGALVSLGVAVYKLHNRIAEAEAVKLAALNLMNQERARKKAHEIAFEKLTDPDTIVAEMERGAVAMEALTAKRGRNVREDAGPHARIYRPRLQSKLPTAGKIWNKNE
jgi:hypothetical protein